MGVSENSGYLILVSQGTILGSPIFGNSHIKETRLRTIDRYDVSLNLSCLARIQYI